MTLKALRAGPSAQIRSTRDRTEEARVGRVHRCACGHTWTCAGCHLPEATRCGPCADAARAAAAQ